MTDVRARGSIAHLAVSELHLVIPGQSNAYEACVQLSAGSDDPRNELSNLIGEGQQCELVLSDPSTMRCSLIFVSGTVMECIGVALAESDPSELWALKVRAFRAATTTDQTNIGTRLKVGRVIASAKVGTTTDTWRVRNWLRLLASGSSSTIAEVGELINSIREHDLNGALNSALRYTLSDTIWKCGECGAPALGEDVLCLGCKNEWTVIAGGHLQISGATDKPAGRIWVSPDDADEYAGRVVNANLGDNKIQIACSPWDLGSSGTIRREINKRLYESRVNTVRDMMKGSPSAGLARLCIEAPEDVRPSNYEEPEDQSAWLTRNKCEQNQRQDRAIQMVSGLQPGQVVCVQGPPGTGKTTMLVEACARRIARDPLERILFLSHSNRAVDHAFSCMKPFSGIALTRVGHESRVVEANREHIWNAESDAGRHFNVYFATIDTASTADATNMDYDLVIVDEANKARLDEVLWAMRHASALVLVGDHKQLPPVEDELVRAVKKQSPVLGKLATTSVFQRIWDSQLPAENKVQLNVQYRMHPDIASYVGGTYKGDLVDSGWVQQYRYVGANPFPVALHFVDTTSSKERHETSIGHRRKNSFEVELACDIIRLLDKRCSRKLCLAVISMYSDQVNALTLALEAERLQRRFRVNTVDAFEGQDEDIVLISTVRSNQQGEIGFLDLANRLNVAISRAKHLVVCIGDSSTLCSGAKGRKLFAPLIDAAKESGGYSSAAKILKWQTSKVRNQQQGAKPHRSNAGPGRMTRPAGRSFSSRTRRDELGALPQGNRRTQIETTSTAIAADSNRI